MLSCRDPNKIAAWKAIGDPRRAGSLSSEKRAIPTISAQIIDINITSLNFYS